MPDEKPQEQNDAIDFLASQLLIQDAVGRGYAAGTRWWCTRDDLKDKFRQIARDLVAKWAIEERETAQRNRSILDDIPIMNGPPKE